MKRTAHILMLMLLPLAFPAVAGAQGGHVRKAMDRARERQEAMARSNVVVDSKAQGKSGYLPMKVDENGDTVFFDRVVPTWIFARRRTTSEKDWREFYKLVYRFPRVYPYAVAAGAVQHTVDSTIKAENMNFIAKDRYITDVQGQLFGQFEGSFRQMTISEGALLMKLIDRETGQSSYSIIKEYKSGVAAGFWQVIAKMFDNDLKSKYDPRGADREVEELVKIWYEGDFPALYWSVFWEDPPAIQVPQLSFSKKAR